jgi:hypothetical protein
VATRTVVVAAAAVVVAVVVMRLAKAIAVAPVLVSILSLTDSSYIARTKWLYAPYTFQSANELGPIGTASTSRRDCSSDMFTEQELSYLINHFLEECQRLSSLNECDLRDIGEEFDELQPVPSVADDEQQASTKYLVVLTFDTQTDHRRSARFLVKQIERDYFSFVRSTTMTTRMATTVRNRARKRLRYRTWCFLYRSDLNYVPVAVRRFTRRFVTTRVLRVYHLTDCERNVCLSLSARIADTFVPATNYFSRLYGQRRALVCSYEEDDDDAPSSPTDAEILEKIEHVLNSKKINFSVYQ